MFKPIRNLPFAALVAVMFGGAIGAIVWAMPLWMLDQFLAQLRLGAIVTQASWAIGMDAGVLVPFTVAGLMAVALCPLIWICAGLIWPSRRVVNVPPLPVRRASDIAAARVAGADAPVLELPKFLILPDATPASGGAFAPAMPAPRAKPILSAEPDSVLIIEPAPVQPPSTPPRMAQAAAPAYGADDESVADLLDRFEQRLARIQYRGLDQPEKALHAPVQNRGVLAFAATGQP